jgi:hypothetical protein
MLAALAEEAMPDGIPLGCPARIMAEGDAKLIGVRQLLLEREFPGAAACMIAAATVGQNE